jgi:hypothetical protein
VRGGGVSRTIFVAMLVLIAASLVFAVVIGALGR